MDEQFLRTLTNEAFSTSNSLLTPPHLRCALDALSSTHRSFRTLICNRQLPEDPLPDASISFFLTQLASLDTNNFQNHVGCGEREGRVFSSLVAQRHFYMSHGVGRSGEVDAHQPKAAGSSLMYPLTNYAVLNAIQGVGLKTKLERLSEALVLPLSTGMAITIVLQTIANKRRKDLVGKMGDGKGESSLSLSEYPRYVICFRIDQKTCLKCVLAAGMIPVVIELEPFPSYTPDCTSLLTYCVRAKPEKLYSVIDSLPGGASSVVAVLSTTSCFIPRLPDPILDIGKICYKYNLPHVVNNAYGLQSKVCCNLINSLAACSSARIDAVIQSTDKNFLTPVGGSVVLGSHETVREISKLYPGRASAAPVVDLLITLLAMGKKKYISLAHEERYVVYFYLKQKLEELAKIRGEVVISNEINDISIGMTLWNIHKGVKKKKKIKKKI